MQAVFINGIGTISPQPTFGAVPFLDAPRETLGNRLTCLEPEYTGWIDPKAIRRMSRVIRMGVAAAGFALKEAGIEKPNAIITGTAFGCLEDTGIFLTKMIEYNEQALNPTPFIQSTHNTIGSQVALLLQCQGYNQTYSHRAFSFENALLDGMMMVQEQQGNILVGGVDEVTDMSYDIINRFEVYKKQNISNLKLFETTSEGSIQGEGASYFLLSNQKATHSYARIIVSTTFYKPSGKEEIYSKISNFLASQQIKASEIDLILLGKNGDVNRDKGYDQIAAEIFPAASRGFFKHLCGEYQTSNAFALWLGAKILKERKVPACVSLNENNAKAPNRILIYNQYFGNHHSLIALESC